LHLRLKKLLFWVAPALWLGCGGGGTELVLPSLSVSTTTSGVELDPDGYGVVVDGTPGPTIGLDATLVVDGLADGTHSVTLSGVAQNCAIQGDNPRIVPVTSGSTARVPFAVTCNPSGGNVAVVTATTGTGSDPDGFSLLVDGTDRGPIGVSSSMSLAGLPPGAHTLGLTGLAANCQVVGDNPRTVSIVAGQTVQVDFSISCTAPGPTAGTLQVTTSTGGADQDTDGYTVTVDGGTAQPIGPNAAIALNNISPSAHTVQLRGMATNCSVSGANPARVTVPAGASATAAFVITCTATAPTLNLRIERVILTQSTQNPAGDVPLVQSRQGYARVFVTASGANSLQPVVRLRFFQGGTLSQTFTIPAPTGSTPTTVQEGELRSSWNVRVPASVFQTNTTMLADVDPGNLIPETNEGDNSYPSSGAAQPLQVRLAPAAAIRFVPVLQSANGLQGSVGGNPDALLQLARRMYPLSTIQADVHAVFTVDGPLQPSDTLGWAQVLTDVDALRVADGSNRTYFGLVKLDYFSGIVGMGFIGTPTAIGTDSPNDVLRVTAHELGHTWGRYHTPCGNPPGLDPREPYPYPNGQIGVYGLDVVAASLKPPTTPDIMGYCLDPWISDYTYKKVLAFREASAISAGGSLSQKQAVLLVWGHIEKGQPVLEPAFQIVTRPSLPSAPGPYSIEATAADGSRLFALSFDAQAVGDGTEDSRHFAFAVPLDQARAARLANIRLVAPGARVAGLSQSVARIQTRTLPNSVEARREASGAVRLQWNSAAHPMVIVRDPDTGEILSFARGGDARVWTSKAVVDLDLSDGVQSQRVRRAISRP
jgi:hypothetical protein